MIVSFLAIAILSVFNIWFIYKDQNNSKAAQLPLTFFIDNSLSTDCLTGTGNYDPVIRACIGSATGYKAWRNPITALSWIQDAQTAGTIDTGGHTIYFRAGIYRDYLNSYVLPSGQENAYNKIEGYQEEDVILSATNLKTNWEDVSNGLYRTTLTGSEDANKGVFEDYQALYSARYPEDYQDLLQADGASGDFSREYLVDCQLNELTSEKIIGSWAQVMVEYFWSRKAKIVSYDSETCRATFSTSTSTPSENNFLETNADGSYKYGDTASGPSDDSKYRLIDNINLLDTPGEYLYQLGATVQDPDYVYMRPISGENPSSHIWEVSSRSVGILFNKDRASGDNVEYIEFRNFDIRFSGGHGLYVSNNSYFNNLGAMPNNLVFDNLHIYNNASNGVYFYSFNNNIIFKNSLVENNGAVGLYYIGPYSYYGYDESGSNYYTVNSEIYNNEFKNNVSCGTYSEHVKNVSYHDNYYEGNGLFNLNSVFSIHGSSDIEVYGNHMFQNGGNGILLEGTPIYRVHHINIHDNLIEEAAYLSPGWVTGVWFSDADDNTLHNNTIYSPNGVALHIDSGQGNKATYNKFLDIFNNIPTTSYGAILLENADGTDPDTTWRYAINNTIAHNLFVGDFKYGLKVYMDIDDADGASVQGNVVANNIFYSTSNSKVVPVSLLYDVDHSLNTYNNNIYYAPSASELKFIYQALHNPATAEHTFANYQTQSNQESNSLNTNPLFTNFVSNIFTLQSNSPARDSAMLLADINDSNYQGSGPDIGPLEYATGPVCGNHLLESGEQCDDGNTTNNDGCSSSCQTEVEEEPGNGGGNNNGGGGTPPPEEPEIACGNSIIEQGEQCDDGNTNNNDGCSYLCQIEEDNTPTTTPNILDISKLQGTIVKTSLDPKVYYINTNNQRYLIPNLNTFKSWFKNFNNLTIITPQTLASFEYKGRLTVKPGKLVQFKNSNKVYAVEPEKTLRWITTGATFKDFGYDFKKVISLPEEDFQYYTLGEDLNNSTVHPTGQLLKHGNFAPIFYIKDNIEYWIKDETTFLSLGFKWQDIITIPVRYWYTRVLDNFSFRLKDR